MDEKSITYPDNLRDEKARTMYAALCDEYLHTHGVEEIPDSSLALIRDICVMEQVKAKLMEDLDRRGPVEHVRNGRQEYWKPNGAIAEINRLSGSQRRNMAELKLTPASGSAFNASGKDDDFTKY